MKTIIDLQRAKEELAKGKTLLDKEQLTEAIELLKPLQPIFKKEEDWENWVKGNNYISRCCITLNKLDEANELLIDTLKICGTKPVSAYETGVCKNNFGVMYMAKGAWHQSIQFFKEAIEQSENGKPVQIARMYLNIGTCYLGLWNHQKALEYYSYFDKIKLDEHDQVALWVKANYYSNKGMLYSNLDHNEYAILHYQKALYILEERLNYKGYVNRAQPTINIANSYIKLKKPEIAEIYYKRGEALARKAFGNNEHPMFFYIEGAKASILIEQKKYKDAIDVYLQIQQKYPNHRDKDILISIIGDAYFMLENYELALDYYKQRTQSINKNDWYRNNELNLKIAETYRRSSKLEQALNTYNEIIESVQGNTDEQSAVTFTYYNDNDQLIFKSTLIGANIYYDYFKISNDGTYLLECMSIVKTGLSVYSKIKNSSTNDIIYKVTVDANKLFQLGAEVCFNIYKINNSIKDLEVAFEASEKDRSIALLKQIGANNSNKILNDSLAKSEDTINFNIKHYEKNINIELNKEEPNRTHIKNWQNKCLELYEQKNELIKQMAQTHPNYFNWKYQTETVTLSNLQQILKADEMLIEYFSTTEHIYIFAINKNQVELVKQDLKDDLQKQVLEFNRLLQGSLLYKIVAAGSALYNLLIKPIEHLMKQVASLKIIPDNALAQLPFEALITQKPATLLPQHLPYLICTHRISYHYSASLYYYGKTQASKQKKYTKQFGGFAPVYKSTQVDKPSELYQEVALRVSQQNAGLSELIYSETEINSVGSLFEKNEADLFLHEQATVKNFIENAANYQYVLIAAHHIYNSLLPENSGILFAPAETIAKQNTTNLIDWSYLDNLTFKDAINSQQMLFESDAYGLNLTADLVVLSCCETGLGKVVTGEGTFGTNRGFLFAGAQNIIYTLFKVYDKQSSKFSFYLFDNIVNYQQTYDEAIRQAKLTMINDELTMPKDWAGYVLMGN